jgi:hypothetical protein
MHGRRLFHASALLALACGQALETVTCDFALVAEDYFDSTVTDVTYGVCRTRNEKLMRTIFLLGGIDSFHTGEVVTVSIEEVSTDDRRHKTMSEASFVADGQPAYDVVSVHRVSQPVTTRLLPSVDKRSIITMRMVYTNGESDCDEDCVRVSMWGAADSVAAVVEESSYGSTTFPSHLGVMISVDMGKPTPSGCNFWGEADLADAVAVAMGFNATSYRHREYIVPGVFGSCSFGGLGILGCAPPFKNLFACRTWIRATHTSIRTHELGHNFGLNHAGDATLAYGDHTSVMGGPYHVMGYNAPNRIQLSWLTESDVQRYDNPVPLPPSPPLSSCLYVGACPNYELCQESAIYCDCARFCPYDSACCLSAPPPPPPTWPPLKVELRSLYLNPSTTLIGQASAVVAPCPSCISNTPRHNDGGRFIVSYRTPHGHDAGMQSAFHNTVSVHFQRDFELGTEIYASLSAGQAYQDPTGYVVSVCETYVFYAVVIITTAGGAVDCTTPSAPPPPPAPFFASICA